MTELANIAYLNSFTIMSIISGCATTCTLPFFRNVFSDEDFETVVSTGLSLDEIHITR